MRPVFYSPPNRPADEAARQAAVDASGVLARDGDPVLQAIVSRAAALFGTPMAAMSIVDRHRQWFAGRVGLDATETSRATSFCGHAILDPGRPLVVPDAALDRRFAGNPLVRGAPQVRFYAGVPLVDAAGHPLGALCVIDVAARATPAPALIDELKALAGEAMAEITAAQRDADQRRTA